MPTANDPEARARIHIDASICGGRPHIRGTRVRVASARGLVPFVGCGVLGLESLMLLFMFALTAALGSLRRH